MYYNKMIAAIAINKNIVREDQEKVYLPFGSEYQIYLKNENTVKALVDVEVDGKSILEDLRLILEPGESHYLSTRMESNKHYNLKFIERTNQISNHRGIEPEDGLIKITTQFFKSIKVADSVFDYTKYVPQKSIESDNSIYKDLIAHTNYMQIGNNIPGSRVEDWIVTYNNSTVTESINRDGITVNGSKRDDISYREISVNDELEPNKSVIIFKLKGGKGEKLITAAKLTRTKQKCPTCGVSNSSNNKFCGNCGTGLEL
jgi:hypothetical protein